MRRREKSKQHPRGNSTGKGIGAGGARICERKRVKIESSGQKVGCLPSTQVTWVQFPTSNTSPEPHQQGALSTELGALGARAVAQQ